MRSSLLFFCIATGVIAGCSGTDSVTFGGGEPTPSTMPNEPGTQPPSGTGEARPENPKGENPGSATPKRVFLTSASFKGNLREYVPAEVDGFVAGDRLCQNEATAQKLTGTFKAYLSGKIKGQTVKAIDRLAEVGPWFLVDKTTKVFDGRAALAKNPLVKIDMLADGKRASGTNTAWTGSRAGIPNGPACEDGQSSSWLSNSSSREGTNGNPLDIARWSDDGSTKDCDESAPLYCFEQ